MHAVREVSSEMSNDEKEPTQDNDPRPVSDDELREEYSRDQVENWRRQADEHHANWFDVLNNRYGKD